MNNNRHNQWFKINLMIFILFIFVSFFTSFVISSSFFYGNTALGKKIVKYEEKGELKEIFEFGFMTPNSNEIKGDQSQGLILEDMAIPSFNEDLLEVYPYYKYSSWNSLSSAEQKELITQTAVAIAFELGIAPPTIIYSTNFDNQVVSRMYLDDLTVEINENMLYDSNEIFKTISHELRHIWQYINFPDRFDNYVKYNSDMSAYQAQWVESDASEFAEAQYNKFITFCNTGN